MQEGLNARTPATLKGKLDSISGCWFQPGLALNVAVIWGVNQYIADQWITGKQVFKNIPLSAKKDLTQMYLPISGKYPVLFVCLKGYGIKIEIYLF